MHVTVRILACILAIGIVKFSTAFIVFSQYEITIEAIGQATHWHNPNVDHSPLYHHVVGDETGVETESLGVIGEGGEASTALATFRITIQWILPLPPPKFDNFIFWQHAYAEEGNGSYQQRVVRVPLDESGKFETNFTLQATDFDEHTGGLHRVTSTVWARVEKDFRYVLCSIEGVQDTYRMKTEAAVTVPYTPSSTKGPLTLRAGDPENQPGGQFQTFPREKNVRTATASGSQLPMTIGLPIHRVFLPSEMPNQLFCRVLGNAVSALQPTEYYELEGPRQGRQGSLPNWVLVPPSYEIPPPRRPFSWPLFRSRSKF